MQSSKFTMLALPKVTATTEIATHVEIRTTLKSTHELALLEVVRHSVIPFKQTFPS